MAKKLIFLIFVTSLLFANKSNLQTSCLSCHQKQNIPSEIIYKKYLLKYSTKEAIEKAIFSYLENPSIKNSVLPKPFFKKFKIKEPLNLNDDKLKTLIDSFIEKFDLKKRLKLQS